MGLLLKVFLLYEEPQALRTAPRDRDIAALFCALSAACCAENILTSTR